MSSFTKIQYFFYITLCGNFNQIQYLAYPQKVMFTIVKSSSKILINWILLGGYGILSAMYEYSQNH